MIGNAKIFCLGSLRLGNKCNLTKCLTLEQSREVRAAMSSPSVAKALAMGIPKEAIQTAIGERLLNGNGMLLMTML